MKSLLSLPALLLCCLCLPLSSCGGGGGGGDGENAEESAGLAPKSLAGYTMVINLTSAVDGNQYPFILYFEEGGAVQIDVGTGSKYRSINNDCYLGYPGNSGKLSIKANIGSFYSELDADLTFTEKTGEREGQYIFKGSAGTWRYKENNAVTGEGSNGTFTARIL